MRAGCLPEHIRFRQHLPDEMAHYASDCWDAEIEMSIGWVECVGVADRSAYDLTVHSAFTKVKLTAEAPLDTPVTVESYAVSKKSLVRHRHLRLLTAVHLLTVVRPSSHWFTPTPSR